MEPKWLNETTLPVFFSGAATWKKEECEQFSFRSLWKVAGNLAELKKQRNVSALPVFLA